MQWLIGIDDTDNLESRGTGFRARQLGEQLTAGGLARLHSITRHQLLVDDRIRYTSHNSSACLAVEMDAGRVADVADFCREFLLRESAAGSDAGLCICPDHAASQPVIAFGRRAKTQVLEPLAAHETARLAGILLQGVTGDGGGVIGALAAVGLRAEGDDGRFLWLNGLRELNGVFTVAQLQQNYGIEDIETLAGDPLPPGVLIRTGEWVRPILRHHRSLLLVEETDTHEWCVAAKEQIKDLSR